MKVEWISFYLFIFSGVVQIALGFFEIVYLKHPAIIKFYNLKDVSNDTQKLFKFRFVVHVFLVLMLIVGLRYIFQGQVRMAGVVTGFSGLGMILSSFGLFWCYRDSWKVVLAESVPVFLGFFFLIFHIIR